jgi:HD-like signal output (HDOD) protein
VTASALSIDELSEQIVPIFAHTARAFRQLDVESNPPWDRYDDIILKDPGLIIHALRQLQGGGGKSSRRPEIASISQLGMLLGMERVKQLPDQLPQVEHDLQGMARQGFARAVTRAFHAAFQAWDWAHITKDHAPHEIFLAAMLHDVAELTLWVMAPEKMHEHRRLMLKDGVPTDEAQYIVFGESLEHFGRQLAVNWGLPPLVHEALRPEQASNPRAEGVMLAVQLARAAERGWYWEKMERLLPLIAEHLSGTEEETTAHIHMNAVRAAREVGFYGARPAAALLPLLPGGEEALIQDEFPEASVSKNAESAFEVEHIPTIAPSSGSSTGLCLMPQPDILKQTMLEIRSKLGELGENEVMRKVVHGMHHGAALNRVVFAALTPNRKRLQASFMTGSDNDPKFNRFEIILDKPHLFTRLMEKPQSLWINDDNRGKFWKLVPESFKNRVQTDSFYVMSLHVHGKPVGLFYADRHRADCHLDKTSYEQFRTLCQVAIKGLSAIS